MRIGSRWLFGALAFGGAAVALAQQPPGMPAPDPAMMERLRQIGERARAMPDTPGTGAYPAVKEELAGLPNHVVYHPADLAKLGSRKLPIIAWGNGGCEADGAGQRLHLEELASHGYLVIANGHILSGPGAPTQPPRAMPAIPKPGEPFKIPPPATTADQLTQAIDWAIKENSRAGSPFYGRIDTGEIAVSGWSCGGVQALRIATSDPRVKAVVIHDSGLFPAGGMTMPQMDVGKDALDRLHTPIIYVLGGPSDVAYPNGEDDFARISKVPAVVVNIGNVGHGGTFYEPNGGKAAHIATAWFDWQLRGEVAAKRMFVGPDCTLCADPELKLQRKGF